MADSSTTVRPSYLHVLWTFASNSLVRDMTFRGNFLLQCFVSVAWASMYVGFYVLIFEYTPMISADSGWGKYEFFVFLATTHFVNSLVQTLFMQNASEFSEMIRTGSLDFVLLKPIDTQFLISLQRIDWSSLANFFFAGALMSYALWQLALVPSLLQIGLYVLFVLCGVAILYSLMISMAATSLWLGRNQSIYDFWFYITNFSRYPMEIYSGRFGTPLQNFFTFVIPILVVVNVPARVMAWPFYTQNLDHAWLPGFAVIATLGSLIASRLIFQLALASYRSASS